MIESGNEYNGVPGLIEFASDLPVCNYTDQVDNCNVGYTQGVAGDGTPFVAELVRIEEETSLSVVIPCEYPCDVDASTGSDSLIVGNVTGFRMEVPFVDMGILDIGMRDLGEEEVLQRCIDLIERIETLGLVQFLGPMHNGIVLYRMDGHDREVAKIIITLQEGNDEMASTPLHFRPFPAQKAFATKVIPFPSSVAVPKEIPASRQSVRLKSEAEIRAVDYLDAVACMWVRGYQLEDDDELEVVMKDGTIYRITLGAEAAQCNQGVYTSTMCQIWESCPVSEFDPGMRKGECQLWRDWRIFHLEDGYSYVSIREDIFCGSLRVFPNGDEPPEQIYEKTRAGVYSVM